MNQQIKKVKFNRRYSLAKTKQVEELQHMSKVPFKPMNLQKSLRLEQSKIIDITDSESDNEKDKKASNNKKN